MTNTPVTNDRLYELVDRMRIELTKKIEDSSTIHNANLSELRRQFETLEAGRLTRLEDKQRTFEVGQAKRDAKIDTNQATLSTKFVILWSIAGAIFVALLTAYATRFVGGKG